MEKQKEKEESSKGSIGGLTTGEGYLCNMLVNPLEIIYTNTLSKNQKDELIKKGYLEWIHVDASVVEDAKLRLKGIGNRLEKDKSGGDVPPPSEKLTLFQKLKKEWNSGKAKTILIRLEERGIITANKDVYDWKIDTEHGYGYNLYAYFVYHASIKLDWMEGKKKNRVPWRKFNPMFPNVSNNQNSRNYDLVCIRQNQSCPSKATIIDEVLNW